MPKLTKRFADAARFDPDGPSWQWMADDEVPGFGVRLLPSGGRSYVLRYRARNGRRRQPRMEVGRPSPIPGGIENS